jgi:glutathione S-transferase
MTEEITLWGANSARAMRVHWMLHEFGLAYDCHPVGSRTGETQVPGYLAMNPKGKIPTLQHGAVTLSESAAIIQYIADAFPAPDDFFIPSNPGEAGRLAEWSYFVAMELDAHSLYVIRRHGSLAHIYGAAPDVIASAEAYFLKQVNAVADRMFAHGPYLMGNKLSTADIILMTCVDWARACEIDLPAHLLAFQARVRARAPYQAAFAVNYTDREISAFGT